MHRATLIKLILYVHLHKEVGNLQLLKCLGISRTLPEYKLSLTSKTAGKISGFISQSLKESLLDKREFKHPMQNILNLSDAAEV